MIQPVTTATGWVAATAPPSELPAAAGTRTPAGEHRRDPARGDGDDDGDRAEVDECQCLTTDHDDNRGDAERARPSRRA